MVAIADSGAVIREDEIYSLSEFLRRTGWSKYALASAKERGLKVVYHGGRGIVRGADYHEFVNRLAEMDLPTPGRKPQLVLETASQVVGRAMAPSVQRCRHREVDQDADADNETDQLISESAQSAAD